MTIDDVVKGLIDDLEDEYTEEQKEHIKRRMDEIAKENNLSLEELDEYCWANSSAMFACIFDGKPFNPEDFIVD